jgi:hypothetical protein
MIKAMVLPYPECHRALLLYSLAEELYAALDTWPEEAGVNQPPSKPTLWAADRESWWATWRPLVQAATGNGDRQAA